MSTDSAGAALLTVDGSDGKEFTSLNSDDVTGDALNIYLTTSVTPNTDSIQQQLGGPPVNSSSSPATLAVKYVKVWQYQ